ncbi:MAG: GNAT family N-acetyltransferase [Candidatus Sulfotelmatobacter sp.]
MPNLIHRTQLYPTLEDIESLRPAWEKLLAEFAGATTFSTWEWLAAWWRAFGEGRELRVLAFFDESATLVGLAPLAISRRRIAPLIRLRVLSMWGDGSGDSDNLDFPVRAGWEQAVAAALFDFLKKQSRQWDFCEFNTMPADSPVARCLAKLLGERGWTTYTDQTACSAISLPETWEEYLKQISSNERGKIAKFRNRLKRKYRVRFYRCEAEKEISTDLEILFSLHGKRWLALELPGSFQSAARRHFYYELAGLLLQKGELEFWLLDLDGQTVAAQFGFRYRNSVFQLQGGFDPSYYSDSVGYLLRAHVIEQLIARGVRGHDFLAGEAPAKACWSAQTRHYLNLQFARPYSLASAYLQIIHAASESKEWLRENLPQDAWRFLRVLKQKLRWAESSNYFRSANPSGSRRKFEIAKQFSRSDPAAEAK